MLQSNFPLLGTPKVGKVRDNYDLGENLLMVATDRISAFDVILPNGIPHKGKVLTMISALWLKKLAGIVPNHLISCDPNQYPAVCRPYADELCGRSMLVKKVTPLPVECIVRGYLAGSGWKSYQKNKTVCGIKLPDGLLESSELPADLFTPSTKAEAGTHDENISFEQMEAIVGSSVAATVKTLSLRLYCRARESAKQVGIIIADTKFEFGLDGYGDVVLIDEILTPDSSRFWPIDGYAPGGPQPSFDKQFVRDYLESIGWNKRPPAPVLPEEVVKKTSKKYLEAYRRFAWVMM